MSAERLRVAALVGLCISLYAVYIEHKNEEDPSYEAVCDVSERMSCSKVLMSEWGHILSQLGILSKGHVLDLANATFGAIYFSVVMFHELLPMSSYQAKATVVFALTLPVVGVSLYLAYILFFVLHDICLVCGGIYVVNFVVLGLSYQGLSSGHAIPKSPGSSPHKQKAS